MAPPAPLILLPLRPAARAAPPEPASSSSRIGTATSPRVPPGPPPPPGAPVPAFSPRPPASAGCARPHWRPSSSSDANSLRAAPPPNPASPSPVGIVPSPRALPSPAAAFPQPSSAPASRAQDSAPPPRHSRRTSSASAASTIGSRSSPPSVVPFLGSFVLAFIGEAHKSGPPYLAATITPCRSLLERTLAAASFPPFLGLAVARGPHRRINNSGGAPIPLHSHGGRGFTSKRRAGATVAMSIASHPHRPPLIELDTSEDDICEAILTVAMSYTPEAFPAKTCIGALNHLPVCAFVVLPYIHRFIKHGCFGVGEAMHSGDSLRPVMRRFCLPKSLPREYF
ncbi:hypothetical protein U9M48_005369 [Paspalum notatum var. saurae]|uniref:Uncharacterized protein n=1 Tax=Paspalum notatum var. saurae TaxID=547442 RepID=A0AAQ3PQP6_PASNO